MLRVSIIVILAIIAANVLLARTALRGTKVACKDERGQPVDWYYMYKLPKRYSHDLYVESGEIDTTGLRYLHISSRDNHYWRLSPIRIADADSMTALTLQPLFDDESVLVIAYNDEFPNGTTIATGGHTKGVVATDGTTGIWLVHSVPKFPTIPVYEYPTSGEHYGQSFLCMTLPAEELHAVGEQLLYNEPNVYYSRVPAALSGKFPNLESVLEGKWNSEAPFHNSLQFSTIANAVFTSFAKSGRFDKELYEDWVAPTLGVNLMVETWRNGGGNLRTNCSKKYRVFNIEEVETLPLHVVFKSTSDHSKWAVSQATGVRLWRWRLGGADWICIGDINRQQHQAKRGGGTVCQRSVKLATLYRDMIGVYEPCLRT